MAKFHEYPSPSFPLDGTEITIIEQEDATASVPIGQIVNELVNLGYIQGLLVNQIPIDELSDVTVTNPVDGEVLTFSSGTWINSVVTATSLSSIEDIGDIVINPGVVNGDFLRYYQGDWISETVPLVTAINDLSDVTIAGLQQGQILWNDGGVWKNSTSFTVDSTGVNIIGSVSESIYSVVGTTPSLSPSNGTIQTWTLTGVSTPTSAIGNGESMLLMVDDGSGYTISWASIGVVWKTNGGLPPTLNTTGYTIICLFTVDNVVYGARVGDS